MQENFGDDVEFDAFGDIEQIPYGERFPWDDADPFGADDMSDLMPSGVFIDGRELSVSELAEYEEYRDGEQQRDDDIREDLHYEELSSECENKRLGINEDDDDNYGGFRRIIKNKRDFV